MSGRKKLIEVALPLEAINKASAREESIRYGHPSTLHMWWSGKPTATARAPARRVRAVRSSFPPQPDLTLAFLNPS